MPTPIIQDLLTLSHEIGREDRGLAMLGEGNTSARLSDETFAVGLPRPGHPRRRQHLRRGSAMTPSPSKPAAPASAP